MRSTATACAAISLCLFLTATSLALGAGPEGSWLCMKETSPVGTLGIRTTSHVLIQMGKVTPGTHTVNASQITVDSGPLKDMGITNGVLSEEPGARTIVFTSDAGTLTCREIL